MWKKKCARQPNPFFLPMRGQDTGGKEEAAGPGEYGDAVLATTDGQRRRSCPTGSERTKPSALDWPLAALKAGEHDLLRCPDVGVSTHPIFPRPRRLLLPSGPPPLAAHHSALSRVKMNSVPTPSVLITLMFWLWALMISLTMESPSPVPLRSFPREESIL